VLSSIKEWLKGLHFGLDIKLGLRLGRRVSSVAKRGRVRRRTAHSFGNKRRGTRRR